MTKRLKIKDLNILFVFRHFFEKDRRKYDPIFKEFRLGVWGRKSKIVSKRHFTKPKKWKYSLADSYTLGVDIILIKFWIEFNINGKIL